MTSGIEKGGVWITSSTKEFTVVVRSCIFQPLSREVKNAVFQNGPAHYLYLSMDFLGETKRCVSCVP